MTSRTEKSLKMKSWFLRFFAGMYLAFPVLALVSKSGGPSAGSRLMETTSSPQRTAKYQQSDKKGQNWKRTYKQQKPRGSVQVPSTAPRSLELASDVTSEKRKNTRKQQIQPHGNRKSSKANSYKSPRNIKPWRASFKASIRTQGRIKKAFNSSNKKRQRAIDVLDALLSTPPHFGNAANVVCALCFSAKALGSDVVKPDSKLRNKLFETLEILNLLVHERQLNTRQLCNACWAIAKHYDRDRELLPPPPEYTAMSSETTFGTAETWDMEESENILSRNQHLVDDTINEIAKQMTANLEESDSHIGESKDRAKVGEICMLSWAFGKLRHRRTPPGWQLPPQLGKLRDVQRPSEFEMASNLITFEKWSGFDSQDENGWQQSQCVTDRLFDAIGASLCPDSEDLDYYYEDSFNRTFLKECTWSELANVGWSFASHGSCKTNQSETLLLGLAEEARLRLEDGVDLVQGVKIRDIAQLLWALGTLQADNFRLADGLVRLVEALSTYLKLDERSTTFKRGRPLRRWSCADLVQVAISLAHARIDEISLLRAVFEECNYRLMEGLHSDKNNLGGRRLFRPWEVSVLLWAQARLYLKGAQGVEFDDFTDDAIKYFSTALAKSDAGLTGIGAGSQEQANIVWSLTVLEKHHSPDAVNLIARIFEEAAETCKDECTIQLEHAHQLWQAYFLLEDESPEAVRNVPTWFSEYLKDKWLSEKAREKLSSARHRSLSQTLHLMGVDHINEHDEDIDVAIVLKENAAWSHQTESATGFDDSVSVAVEFDGPNHFTRERDPFEGEEYKPRALGHTVLKYRLLKKQGWSVVRVPYYEFDKIPFWASMERQRYLQRKLKTHPNIKFSESDVSEYKVLTPDRKSRFD